MYLRTASIMTVVAIAAKLILFLLDLAQEQMAMFTIFANLLIILVGSFFTVRWFKMNNRPSVLKEEVKAGMKTTTLFALFMSIFVLIYYSYIDTHYFPNMIENRVELAKAAMADNPNIDLDNVRKTGEMLFSSRTHASITLFGLTVTGGIYVFLLCLLMRRIPGFR